MSTFLQRNRPAEIQRSLHLRQRPGAGDSEERGASSLAFITLSLSVVCSHHPCPSDRCAARRERGGQDAAVGRGDAGERQSSATESRPQPGAEAGGNTDLGGRGRGGSSVRWALGGMEHQTVATWVLILLTASTTGGAALEQLKEEKEFAEGQVRPTVQLSAALRVGQGQRVPGCLPSDQLPEQRHRWPAAEERGAEDQAEEARTGRVQRQRWDWWVKKEIHLCYYPIIVDQLPADTAPNWLLERMRLTTVQTRDSKLSTTNPLENPTLLITENLLFLLVGLFVSRLNLKLWRHGWASEGFISVFCPKVSTLVAGYVWIEALCPLMTFSCPLSQFWQRSIEAGKEGHPTSVLRHLRLLRPPRHGGLSHAGPEPRLGPSHHVSWQPGRRASLLWHLRGVRPRHRVL